MLPGVLQRGEDDAGAMDDWCAPLAGEPMPEEAQEAVEERPLVTASSPPGVEASSAPRHEQAPAAASPAKRGCDKLDGAASDEPVSLPPQTVQFGYNKHKRAKYEDGPSPFAAPLSFLRKA